MLSQTIFLLLAIFTSVLVFPQVKTEVDSLTEIASKSSVSNERVQAQLALALLYSGLNSTKSEKYALEAISLSDQVGFSQGRADALYVLSRNALLKGVYDEAAIQLDSLLRFAEGIDYKKGVAYAHFGHAWLKYYRGDYQESVNDHMKSLAIREEINDKENIGSSYRGLGITYKLIGDFDQALSYLNRSLAKERQINNRGGIAESLNHLGVIYGLRGDYPSALNAYYEALEIVEAINDQSSLAYTYQNIALIHKQQGEFGKTLEFLQKSLEIRQVIGETRGVAQVNFNIGEVYHDESSYDLALKYYLNALKIKKELGDKRGEADALLAIGKLFADQNEYNIAIEYELKSLEIARIINSDWGAANALIALGTASLKLGQRLEAKEYFSEGLALAESSQLAESLSEVLYLLSEAEHGLGNSERAFELLLKHKQVSDSLSNDAVTKRITLLEANFEFKQITDSINFANERARIQLDQKINSQRKTQMVTLVGLFALVIVIAVLYRYIRLKAKTNEELSRLNEEVVVANNELKQLNEEKNNLIGIVAHDLKSPLSAVIGAVNIMNTKGLDQENRMLHEIILDASTRMQHMITEILNVEAIEKSLGELNVQPLNVSQVVDKVIREQSEMARKKDIQINTSVEADLIGMVDERYIFQVVENLLSNAIKFSPVKKQVFVDFAKKDGELILKVRDEGPGLSEEDQKKLFKRFQRLSAKPTADESSTGLGLSIVKKFVDQMEGSVQVESQVGEGASFYVKLKAV